MSNIIFFDTLQGHTNLLPLAYTRPIADFRVGILTIRQKWQYRLNATFSYKTVAPLDGVYPCTEAADNIYIYGGLLPDDYVEAKILSLRPGEALWHNDELIALRGTSHQFENPRQCDAVVYDGTPNILRYVYDVFLLNAAQIEKDFRMLTQARISAPLHPDNLWIGPRRYADGLPAVFIEKGASLEGVTLNTSAGPIYIGAGAEVMEGSCIRGPFALGEHSVVKMGAKIYGGTTIGPYCKVGGELNNAVIFGYSNKAHDGFLGNAVIGEWCNIGAGTNASNLKNDYAKIRVWNYASRSFMRTDLQFCGLIMADHSRIGINGMLNTATVMGVGVNLHGTGFPRTFIPSFSKGSPSGGFSDISVDEFMTMAERMMCRRGIALTEKDRLLFAHVAEKASEFKNPSRRRS